MADLNISAVRSTTVRKSFVVTVNVDESRTADDLKFINPSMGKAAVLDALMNAPGEVFFEGQEDLASRWMSMGNGALPLNLFMSAGVDVSPAPVDNMRQARAILHQLYDNGDLDCLPTDEAYDALHKVGDLIIQAELTMLNA